MATLVHATNCLVGYDCGAVNTNITQISLREIGNCEIEMPIVETKNVIIQLLQILEFNSAHTRYCKIKIHRTITKCLWLSRSVPVKGGTVTYIGDITRDQCDLLHETGRFMIGKTIIDSISPNSTTTHAIVFAGTLNSDGKCEGASYADVFGEWDNSIVQGYVTITITDREAPVDIKKNTIQLLDGTVCPINPGRCRDFSGTQAFWNPLPQDSCNFNKYGVLYEGPADKIEDSTGQYGETVYSVTSSDITFALATKHSKILCGYTLIDTEHPKLFILEGKSEFFNKPQRLDTHNLDLFTYMNSKFVYLEKHFRKQLNYLYYDVLVQRCLLNQQVLLQSQTIALLNPDEFAYNYMNGPGYTALITGEVILLVKCVPVDVKVKRSDNCYKELAVSKEGSNDTLFLSPRTHVLKRVGYQVRCNALMPIMYKIDGQWYNVSPYLTRGLAPYIMKPNTNATWTYLSPYELAKNGIYTQDDLEDFHKAIMSISEQPAMINDMIMVTTGQKTLPEGMSIQGFFDENAIEKITTKAWTKIWFGFEKVGSVTSSFLGIIILFRIAITIFDVIMQSIALHRVYGWSVYLIGAIFHSITNYLLHSNHWNKTSCNHCQKCEDSDPKETKAMTPLYPTQEEIECIERDRRIPIIHENTQETPVPVKSPEHHYGLNI